MIEIYKLKEGDRIEACGFNFVDKNGRVITELKFIKMDGMYGQLKDEFDVLYLIAGWYNVKKI